MQESNDSIVQKFKSRDKPDGLHGKGDRGLTMLGWALTFLVIAIIAAIFGFGGIAGTAAGIAQVLFYIFLAVFLISVIMGLARGRRP